MNENEAAMIEAASVGLITFNMFTFLMLATLFFDEPYYFAPS
ncbi:putative membrane protein [Vibrio parahaemolyticus 10296]|nr:putative membrane protein [Vibrio parahaemolyticus 10296]